MQNGCKMAIEWPAWVIHSTECPIASSYETDLVRYIQYRFSESNRWLHHSTMCKEKVNTWDLDVDGKWHDKHGDHEISDGQWHDEVVSDGLQTAFCPHTGTDQRVAEHRRYRKHKQQQRPEIHLHGNDIRWVARRGVRRFCRVDVVQVDVGSHRHGRRSGSDLRHHFATGPTY